jgi:hypothetical protein
MDFHYTFTTLEDMKQLKLLVDFMASQDIDYPHYDEWLQRAESQMEKGEKEAILAFSGRKLAGDLVTQMCKDSGLGSLLEIKNARVHPDLRDRHFMTFMLKQLYRGYENKYDGMIVDVRASQPETLNYLVREGFAPIAKTTLYEKNMEEITLFKPLKKEAERLMPIARKIIMAKSIF